MPDKVLAFYIRLSSEDRDLKTNALKNESNSVFNQRRLLQDYYDTHESLHGYKVIVFCDDGVTGTHFDRPKFDELIEMARNQEIHCIMVKDLSRFGRNFLEMGNYLELILPLYGVRFISINDAFDSDDYLGVTGGLELALRKPKMRSLPRDQWIIVPGTHEAIISEELFRTAQNALQGRIRNVNKNTAGNRANNLFVCGCCGRKLRKNPAKEPHLVCPKNDSIKGAECAGLFVNQAQIEQAVLQMLREQSRSFLEQHCLMQACIDKKLSSIQTELDANTNMTRRLQSRKAELYEQYRAGRISREKFADIQKTDSEKLARLSSRAEEIKRLLVEHYESRGNLAAGKRTADQIILLKDYDPEIIRNFVERVRVYPSGEIEIDMRTSSGFEFVTAS